MQSEVQSNRSRLMWRIVAGLMAVTFLLLIFLFQRTDFSGWFTVTTSAIHRFLINRSVRFILNDLFATLLVFALFGKREQVTIAVYVQIAGIFFLLIPYIIFKIYFPGYNGPLISFLHRLILNPLLIYALIFFFWHQQRVGRRE